MRHKRLAAAIACGLITASCTPVPVGAAEPVAESGQYQLTPYWCVPASAAVSLAQMGAPAQQYQLAADMGTTTGGTGALAPVLAALDSYATPRGYAYRSDASATDPTTLGDDLNYDVNGLHQYPVALVWFALLPWSDDPDSTSGHAIVVVGYDPASEQVLVWDPYEPDGGQHQISLLSLSKDLQPRIGILEVVRNG